MCIACVLPKGTTITEKEFQNCWENNPHGGGYSYISPDGNLVTQKSMDYDELRTKFSSDFTEHGEYSNFILHFRIASEGSIDISNVHPFNVHNDLVMMHNGTMRNVVMQKEDTRSDTRTFVEDYLRNLPKNFLRNTTIKRFILDFAGSSNKLVFFDKVGNYYIFNHSAGYEDNNRWFSTKAYSYGKPVVVTPPPTTTPSSYGRPYQSSLPAATVDRPVMRECSWCGLMDTNIELKQGYRICKECLELVDKFKKFSGEHDYAAITALGKLFDSHVVNRKLIRPNQSLWNPNNQDKDDQYLSEEDAYALGWM